MANSLEDVFTSTTGREWEDRIVILGGGIVGSSLAYFISHKKPSSSHIILLDASLQSPQGSTAFAPGLVGQLNEIDHLTQMAKESVEEYSKIHGISNFLYGSVRDS
jgi:sarcosine oxidase